MQYKTHLSSLYTKSYLNSTTNRRLILILGFLLLVYLKLIVVYVLVSYYLLQILYLSIQCDLNQRKVGLLKCTTTCYLEISKFIIILIAIVPLLPKLMVWYTTNEFRLNLSTILFKICFTILLVQLHFKLNQRNLSQKRWVYWFQ